VPSSSHYTDAWFGGSLQVSYTGENPTVEYIELSAISGLAVMLLGLAVFSTPASLLVPRIQERAALDSSDPELGYSYIFPSLELSLWRAVAEQPDGRFFSTIGIGIDGYYSQRPDA
jgi:hypothetical protein